MLSKVHPQLDLQFWEKLWDGTVDHFLGPGFSNPLELLSFNATRQRLKLGEFVAKKEIDLIFWSTAPSLSPNLTRLGGVPYRPRDRDWPCNLEGLPLTFIGQFNLQDSQDILPTLPGDLLLVFAESLHLNGGKKMVKVGYGASG